MVSGGDPGVFAMAAAVFEAVETGDPTWRALDIRVEPGVTAMLAAAAEVGAPLGGDFCAISLSDNLKAWATIERRLQAAAEADFVIALYNPASKARPHQLGAGVRLLRTIKAGETPVLFVRAAGDAEAKVIATTLAEADAALADMRTLVIVGASTTRRVGRWVYTPRASRSAREALQPATACLGVGHDMAGRLVRPRDHDDRQAERARRLDLGVGRRRRRNSWRPRTSIFSSRQQARLGRRVERSARLQQADVGRQVVAARGGSIDARDIVVLRRRREGAQLEAAEAEEDAARRPRRAHGRRLRGIAHDLPVVAGSGCQAGRTSEASGTPACAQAATALAEIWSA